MLEAHVHVLFLFLISLKDAASFKISSLSKQLTESVPLIEVEETKAQMSSVCGQYQALLSAQVAVATGQTEERIRELSLALNESKVREREILERVTNGNKIVY